MKIHVLCLALLCSLSVTLSAKDEDRLRYIEASGLHIINNAQEPVEGYARLNTDLYPDLSDVVRKYYGYSTGLAVTFRTDSRTIAARWATEEGEVGSNRTPLAEKGMDMYILKEGEWIFAGVAKPSEGNEHNATILKDMEPGMKECLLYLPLYDRVKSLEIGVNNEAVIEAGDDPFRGKVVVLGSSITHGASATRPGLTYTARLERSLGIEMANLGASGRFKLDSFFLPVIADTECDAFIIDAFSNPSAKQINSRLGKFVDGVRESHPETPIIFLQTLVRETGNFDIERREFEAAKRAAADSIMSIVTKKHKNVYFLNPGMDIGADHEGTVDGVHPNDMGFDRMLKVIEPRIARILSGHGIPVKGTFSHEDAALDTLRNNYQGYPFPETADSRAPKGYEPFYMSHYGRHGSRYLEKEDILRTVLIPLEQAERHGNLTATGEMLMADIRELDCISEGMYGMITEKGGDELAELGRRCAKRFPEIFSNRERGSISCVASPRQRCIMSMGYYITEIIREYPELEAEYFTGDRYLEYICRTRNLTGMQKVVRERVDRMFEAELAEERICSELFINPSRVDFNPWGFCEMLFHCAADITCLKDGPDLFKYMTDEEIRTISRLHNNRICYTHANSAFSAAERLPEAYDLVNDVIEKAEQAVAGNDVAADFRFGHDSGLMPLMAIFNIEGYDVETTLENADKHWNAAFMSPMAANFQMILYRSPKSDRILVKVLFNEREKTITGLKPVQGCYYDWNELSDHLRSRMK